MGVAAFTHWYWDGAFSERRPLPFAPNPRSGVMALADVMCLVDDDDLSDDR